MGRHQAQIIAELMRGAGFYSWSLGEDMLTADKAFADIYEIDEADIARGIPVELILSRIVEEDRPRLAQRIHDVILGGEPLMTQYRILCPSGRYKCLMSMGSCAKDVDGISTVYSGVVIGVENVASDAAQLEHHIFAALDIAKDGGKELTGRYLSSALRSL